MNDLLETWLPNVSMIWPEVWDATYETLYMVIVGAVIGYAIGLVLGLLLLLTRRGGLTQNVIVYNILDKIVNIVRSIPFIILMALLVGVTRVIVGTSIGTEAMIVPIAGATVPFYARQVENALLEIDPGLVEAAKASGLGSSTSYGACTCAKGACRSSACRRCRSSTWSPSPPWLAWSVEVVWVTSRSSAATTGSRAT